MRKKNRLKIGVDVDDVLYLCNQHAIDLLARERNIDGLDIFDIDAWGSGSANPLLDERLAYFSRPDFVAGKPVIPGAQEFISQLCERGEVFFVTAVGKSCMNERASRLVKDFPQVPERNIIIGARKDLVSLDILLDDGAHNILGSNAKYPVLFRRPWNNNLTGLLAVNSYADFLRLVDQISGQGSETLPDLADGGIVWDDAHYRLSTSGLYSATSAGFDIYDAAAALRYCRSEGLRVIKMYPVLGTGPDNFAFTQLHTTLILENNDNTVDRPYNDYLFIAATRGILSAVLHIVLLIVCAVLGWKHRKSAYGWILGAAGGAVLLYSLTALVGISVLTVAPLFWMLLGILAGEPLTEPIPSKKTADSKQKKQKKAKPAKAEA